MWIFLESLAIIAVALVLTFLPITPLIWTLSLAIVLMTASFFSGLSWLMLIVFWLIFLCIASVIHLDSLRCNLITRPLLKYFKKVLPPISETERIALEAGQVWIEGGLFQGKPDWNEILNLRIPHLSDEEQQFIDNEVEQLCKMTNDWQLVNELGELPQSTWDFIKKNGFLGLIIPKKYGGKEFSVLAHSTIITKISSRSVSTAVSVMVPNSLGPAELLINYGTEQQKDYYLPRLANGREIPCFALTGVEAGSDAGAISDYGIVVQQQIAGENKLFIKLTWDKRYITLAPIATVLGLAFKLNDPDNLLQLNKRHIGITVALIPTNHPGVEIGNRHSPANLAFMNGTTRGKDVLIPLEWVIGGKDRVGQGWQMLMEELSVGRSISLPALATATGKLCYRMTGAYAALRKQFKQSIVNFDGIATVLARIGGFTYIMEATRMMTADAVGQGVKPSLVSAIAKYHITEMGRMAINDAMDIHGGRGVQFGPRNYLGIHYVAMPISITVEGANILTRNLMIFGQGAMRCHPYIRQEIAAANLEGEKGMLQFDNLILQHGLYTMQNMLKTFSYGISGGVFISSPRRGAVAKYFRQLTRMSAALAFTADVAMTLLGGELKRLECLSARLGDVLSNLYLGVAVLKYYQDQQANEEDLLYVDWSLQTCLYNIQQALHGFLLNFPWRSIAILLRFIIFPLGMHYKMPSDKLSRNIAKHMTIPSEFRDRITKYCFVGEKNDDPTGRVELALQAMFKAQAAEIKLNSAIRDHKIKPQAIFEELINSALQAEVISKVEADDLIYYEKLRQEAMKVDEFPFEYFDRHLKPKSARIKEEIVGSQEDL